MLNVWNGPNVRIRCPIGYYRERRDRNVDWALLTPRTIRGICHDAMDPSDPPRSEPSLPTLNGLTGRLSADSIALKQLVRAMGISSSIWCDFRRESSTTD